MDGDETTMCDDLDLINGLTIVVVDECVGVWGPNGFRLLGVLFLDVQTWLNTHDNGLAPGSKKSAIASMYRPSSREEMHG